MKCANRMHRFWDVFSILLANRKGHFVGLLAFYLLLLNEYGRFVVRNYAYMGFVYEPSPLTLLIGVLFVGIVLGVLFFLHPSNDRIYALGILIAILFCFPNIVMYQLGGTSPYGSIYSMLFFVLVVSPILPIPNVATLPRVPLRLQQWALPLLVVLLSIPFVCVFGIPKDFSVFSLNGHIYEVREAVSGKDNLYTAYMLGPLCKVLLPMIIVMGLCSKRNWWMTVMGVLMMLLLFMINPQKSILFSIVVVLVLFMFKDCSAKAGMVLYGMLFGGVVGIMLNVLIDDLWVESILIRRIFFIPASVSEAYFVFFEDNPLFLSHSFLSHFFSFPYPNEPANTIGYAMYDTFITNCNTGIFGDGFMNFGHIGSVLFVLLAATVVKYIDATDYDSRFFGMVVLLVFTFQNSAFFTTMLTHGGVLLGLVMMFIVPRREVVA